MAIHPGFSKSPYEIIPDFAIGFIEEAAHMEPKHYIFVTLQEKT